jgi:hypothetical protein
MIQQLGEGSAQHHMIGHNIRRSEKNSRDRWAMEQGLWAKFDQKLRQFFNFGNIAGRALFAVCFYVFFPIPLKISISAPGFCHLIFAH